nr:hypothetical protein [Tanacetum cinerariifolium]
MMITKRINIETRQKCLGSLEHHGDFNLEEEQIGIDLYKGLDIYIEPLSDRIPFTREQTTHTNRFIIVFFNPSSSSSIDYILLQFINISARSSVSQNSVSSDVVVESSIPSGTVVNAFTKEIIAYEKESDETHAVKRLDALCTPESFVTHFNFDTPGGTVYYIPKYVAEAGFVVRSSCQKRLRNEDVKKKYLVCNRKGCTKGIHIDTLDLENSDKQKRNSYLHITGCKTHAVFNLDPRTRKFVLNVFDTIHNHEFKREEFKHLSKRERKLTYLEQAFIVKAASMNIGATRAHHLVTVIDNHRKYVTVAACLLKNETTKSYIWLLKAFIKAFGKAPSIVVTDQDGAMRNAIEAEFAGLKHRLCMWHITQKLPAKIDEDDI